ncbi:MAG: Hpt domain-containing protein [Phycisphaerales bacterium]|nr:Hpt domain-containing protein [Phycisphaerales bacterium]
MPDEPMSPLRPLISEFADEPELKELVQLFTSELPDRVRAIENAWSTREVTVLRRMVHQLRGASAGYGYPTIGHAAGAIEDRLRELGSTDEPGWLSLRRQVDQLVNLCRSAAMGVPRA